MLGAMATARANITTKVGADTSEFSAAMRRVGAQAQGAAGKIGRAIRGASATISRMTLIAGAASAAVAAIGGRSLAKGLKGAADLGGALSDLSSRTGIAAGELAIMQRAFEDNGVAASKLGSVINKMQRSIVEALERGGTLAEPFDKIGLSLQELSSMRPEQQFAAIQRAISSISDPTQRAAAAMQIFGKSGGELLTLFADTGALSNAGKFLGKQSVILNESSVLFDEISDKLARIPAKLQGFFVGFLEPIASEINASLDRFEKFDFADLGQRISEGLKNINFSQIVELYGNVAQVASMALIDGLGKVVQFFSALMVSVWQSEVVPKLGSLLLDALFAVFNSVGNAVNNAANWLFGFESEGVQVAKTFAETLQEQLDQVDWSPGEAMTSAVDDLKVKLAKLFPEVNRAGSASSAASAYDAELAEQRKRVAADTAAMAAKSAIQWGRGSSSIANRIDTNERPDGLFAAQRRYATIGQTGAFARDRARLGIASGLTTGGLGEKRRVGQGSADKVIRDTRSLQEKQVDHLESMDKTLKQAITVA